MQSFHKTEPLPAGELAWMTAPPNYPPWNPRQHDRRQ